MHTAAASPFTLTWQIQTDDIAQITHSIEQAAKQNVPRVQLSHRVIHAAEQLWEPRQDSAIQKNGAENYQETLRKIVHFAKEKGLCVDIWTHEISGARAEEMTHWKDWKDIGDWLREKYNKAFKLIPGIDGLVLTLAETDFSVYNKGDGQRKGLDSMLPWLVEDAPRDRITHLLSIMHDICKEGNKTLIVRSFVYEPAEIKIFTEAVNALGEERLNGNDLIFMSKCVPHDWQPSYPWNPDIGQLPHQWVEIDHGQEFTGQSLIMRDEVDYTKSMVAYASAKGVEGFVTRIERYQNPALRTPNALNLFALRSFITDISQTSEDVRMQWINETFSGNSTQKLPTETAHTLAKLTARTFQVTNIMFFPLGCWITNHSQLPRQSYITSSLRDRKTSKWTHALEAMENEQYLDHPNQETLTRIKTEKKVAVKSLQQSLNDLNKIREAIGEENYRYLGKHLSMDLVKVFKVFQLATFGARYYQSLPKEHEEERTRVRDQVLKWTEQLNQFGQIPEVMDYFKAIRSHIQEPEKNYWACYDELRAMVDATL